MKKGSKMTEEQRQRLSEAHKGQVAWNKNIKLDRMKFPTMGHFKKNSEETKKKISEATKKAMANPEIRRKLKESHIGKHLSEEHKLKISESGKGRKLSEEIRRKIGLANIGKIRSEEIRKKLSKLRIGKSTSRKGKTLSSEWKKKLSESHKGQKSARKGIKLSNEERKKVGEATKKAMANPETRKRFLEANMERYLNPVSLEKIKEQSRRTILKLFESGSFPKQTDTKPERQIKEELIKRGYKEGIDFIHQYKFMNKFMCDFCFPNKKVVIEVDGDFWHANPEKYPDQTKLHKHQIKDIGRDKSKNAYIAKVDGGSWKMIRLWESDIQKNVVEGVDKIEEALKRQL